MITRVGAGRRGEQAILRAARIAMHQQHGDAPRADRQRGDGPFQFVAADRRVGVEPGDGGFDKLPAPFGADDQAGPNLAELDHVRHLHDAVENSQAGVRDVVDQAFVRQAEPMMDGAGRGGLEKIAADRGMDQAADFGRIERRGLQGPLRRSRRFSGSATRRAARSAAARMPVIISSRPGDNRSR